MKIYCIANTKGDKFFYQGEEYNQIVSSLHEATFFPSIEDLRKVFKTQAHRLSVLRGSFEEPHHQEEMQELIDNYTIKTLTMSDDWKSVVKQKVVKSVGYERN